MKTIVMQDALEIANTKREYMCKRNARVKKLVRQKTRVKFAMNQQMLANPMVRKENNNNNKKEEKREI